MTSNTENQANSEQNQQNDALLYHELPPRLSTSVQRSPPPHVSNQNIFAVLLKNKRQITSLTAGLLVLLGSGVHTVWTFWEIFLVTPRFEEVVLLQIGSWYLASIIGSTIAAILIPKRSKKYLYIIAALLLLASSLLYIALCVRELRVSTIILCGRILAGLANGIAYLTVITHAAENAVNQIRGLILRGIGYVLAFSLFIAGLTTYIASYGSEIGNDYVSEVLMGIVNATYSVLAIIAAVFLTIESAPHQWQQMKNVSASERESRVIETMIKLRNEHGETPKIRHDFSEMKHQLNEDELNSRNPFGLKNIRPLAIVIGVRVLSVCAKNIPFSVIIMTNFNDLLESKKFSEELLFVMLASRFIFGIITMFLIDKFERKHYLYIFSVACGILLLVWCLVQHELKFHELKFSYCILIFFVFGSMGIDCVGHVQTSEAFSYATKSWSITIATAVEHTVHMIFITAFKYQQNNLTFLLISIGLIVLGFVTLLTVPAKTKGLSLRQTRDIYRKVKFVLLSENV